MTELRSAFQKLAVDGVQGLAPYEPGKPMEELQREYGLTDIIKLASNENPRGPGPRAVEAARAAAADLHRYPDGNGFRLKHALAVHHGVAPETITLGNGSNDVLALAASTFLGPGREAVFSEHAFAVYPIVTAASGATARVAPALGPETDMPFGHDLDAMRARVGEATRVVFVANPNNPTGTWVGREALKDFLRSLPEHVIAVVDEAYCEYADHPGMPDATEWLSAFPNLVVTRTFSKIHGLAGLRAGYSISHPAVAELFNRVRQPFNMNACAQAAAEAALADQEYVRASVALNTEQRDRLRQGLEALGLDVLPSAANFLCVRVGDAAAVNEGLLRAGVIVRPVAGYGLPEWIRVTVGLPEENERFLRALSAQVAGD
ncbi:histidinol-phosphate transaminase [Aquisalimonas lutea]|uniref:histidinol-phosphate transaminase n=1 Tax=Aquisalimonas lutea TaxID=1327750 RepID=UPI0025B54289|nr:histidinol-phosphate transaminase [Aquisalimonas lutea]MDN3517684.1 histidinol-phosphate transaminase [Aquisalimonas lutea]